MIFRKFRKIWLLIIASAWLLCCSLGFSRAEAAITQEELQQSELRVMCAWASMAAYDSQLDVIARQELAKTGYDVQVYDQKNNKVDSKYFLITNKNQPNVLLLAIPGTRNIKDIKLDIDMSRTCFGGATPEEFREYATAHDSSSQEPVVHNGFNKLTNELFFTGTNSDRSFGEGLRDRLLLHPDMRLIITGHSLGGAVATLLGTRLMCMGVPAKQLQVITFGAPAVGNARFVKMYGDKLPLERVTLKTDPVKKALQLTGKGFTQCGKNIDLADRGDKFPHAVVVYADVSLKDYLDTRHQVSLQRNFPLPKRSLWDASPAKVYFAAPELKITEQLGDEAKYMTVVLRDAFQQQFPQGLVGDGEGARSLTDALQEARKHGCSYVIRDTLQADRLKEGDGYRISLHEEIYKVHGSSFYDMQETVTNTRLLTPLEAVIYDYRTIKDKRREL